MPHASDYPPVSTGCLAPFLPPPSLCKFNLDGTTSSLSPTPFAPPDLSQSHLSSCPKTYKSGLQACSLPSGSATGHKNSLAQSMLWRAQVGHQIF